MSEPMFTGELVMEATAFAIHPEGTVLDENGHPIAPQEED